MTDNTSQYRLVATTSSVFQSPDQQLYGANLETLEYTQIACDTWLSTWSPISLLTTEDDISKCLAVWRSHEHTSTSIWNALSIKRLSEFTTVDEVIDFIYADYVSRFKVCQTTACEWIRKPDPEAIIELEVVQQFKKVAQVQSIYTNTYMRRKQFLILTSNQKYDDQLMDQLLSIEYEFHLAQIQARFVYIPRLFESPSEVVPRESKLIYERDLDVIIHSPLASGQTQRELGYPVAR